MAIVSDVTALTDMYDELRAQPLNHRQALRVLARRICVDEDTVTRALSKAQSATAKVYVATATVEGARG